MDGDPFVDHENRRPPLSSTVFPSSVPPSVGLVVGGWEYPSSHTIFVSFSPYPEAEEIIIASNPTSPAPLAFSCVRVSGAVRRVALRNHSYFTGRYQSISLPGQSYCRQEHFRPNFCWVGGYLNGDGNPPQLAWLCNFRPSTIGSYLVVAAGIE